MQQRRTVSFRTMPDRLHKGMRLLRFFLARLLMLALLLNGAGFAVSGANHSLATAMIAATSASAPCHTESESQSTAVVPPHITGAAHDDGAGSTHPAHDCCKPGCSNHCGFGTLALVAPCRVPVPHAANAAQAPFSDSGYVSPALPRHVRPPIA